MSEQRGWNFRQIGQNFPSEDVEAETEQIGFGTSGGQMPRSDSGSSATAASTPEGSQSSKE